MQLAAITLARFVAFIETVDLNPRGRVYFPQLANALVVRYGFAKFPQKLDEFDEAKGVTFEGGRLRDVTINRVQIFNNVLVVETAASTAHSEEMLEDALVWGSEQFGLLYKPGMIKRKAYVSQLTFYSDQIVSNIHPALARAAQRLNARVPEYFGLGLHYKPSGVTISHDPLSIKNGAAPFTIEPRAETRYSDNKYFSTAPLPTEEHIGLLEMLEAEMRTS